MAEALEHNTIGGGFNLFETNLSQTGVKIKPIFPDKYAY